jgi:hypothetical protein
MKRRHISRLVQKYSSGGLKGVLLSAMFQPGGKPFALA